MGTASTDRAPSPAGPSLLGRALLALALTVVFYTLAIAVSLLLVGLPVGRWATGHGFPIFWGIAMVIAGVCILASLVPRRDPFHEPGPALTREEQPELVGLVEDVAREVGHPMPDRMYLDPDANAGVLEHGRPLGRKERILVLGLPLLELLTVDQLRAVLAHEFGHYAGGDTRIGRWVYRTRRTILRTVESLDWRTDADDDDGWFERGIRAPFELYAKLFVRITSAVSRREEFAADAVAIRVAGRDAHVGALRRVAAGAPAYNAFWDDELVPALNSGVRPPVGEGFRRFMSTELVDKAVTEVLEGRLEQAAHDPYDSHPTLRQRLEAVGADPHEDPVSDGPPAASLLRDHDRVEHDLFLALAGPDAEQLRPVRWEDLDDVWLDGYRRLVAEFGTVLDGKTLGDLPDLVRNVPNLAMALRRRHEDIPGDAEAKGLAGQLLGAAMITALVREGFALQSPPGEPIACVRGDERFLPWNELAVLDDPESGADTQELRARLDAAGVATAPLVDEARIEPRPDRETTATAA